jgi:hypothetical protein
MAFNSYTSFAAWASKVVRGTKSFAGLLKSFGVKDPYELQGWNPKLKLIREIPLAPGTRGCRVSERRSPLHPISRHKHNLVPEGDDRPALLDDFRRRASKARVRWTIYLLATPEPESPAGASPFRPRLRLASVIAVGWPQRHRTRVEGEPETHGWAVRFHG